MKLYRYRATSANTFSEIAEKKAWYSRYAELNDPYEGRYINKSNDPAFDYLIKTYLVCCFSKNNNNFLMWAHYAENHKGICLEYDVEEEAYKTSFMEITYAKSLPELERVERYPAGHPSAGAISANIKKDGPIFLTKSVDWKYEEEVRTLRISQELWRKGEKHPVTGGKLSAVYFGLRTDETTKAIIRGLVSTNSRIQFWQALSPPDQFALEFVKV